MRSALPFVVAGVALTLTLSSAAPSSPAALEKPNIIFILADDLGLDGVGCFGSDNHKTPNIDRLAASGIRFETCYAAPLCGPSRCLLMTGRYAFRTGGLGNQSWRPGGTGAKSADEVSMAKLLKQNGYVTGQAGKWRQMGETPRDWGFEEYLTDPTAGGWYWEANYLMNGTRIHHPQGTYGPDVIQEFTLDYIRRHKNEPFFFYYAMHLVHAPILRTSETAKGRESLEELYEDNIRYMDKQVGELVKELEKLGIREKTLIVFAGDNGTALNFASSIGGRRINGKKASMLEGGSRVPLIASWPGVTPAGRTIPDLVSFADVLPTVAELAGARLPPGVKVDGQSFAQQLHGNPGKPREWVFVQLASRWYVREKGFKLNERGELFDMDDAPFAEKLISATDDTEASKAARTRLTAVLSELNPAGGKTEAGSQTGPKATRKKKRKHTNQ